MRPVRSAFRFMTACGLAAIVFASLPAVANPVQENATPAASRQPSFDISQESGVVESRLRIPAIGLDETIRSGIAQSVVDRGVAHWVGTSEPGGSGNVVLAGHRTTHSRPFWDLGRLENGDLVFVQDRKGFEVMYKVADSFVVEPDDVWISYDFGKPMVTMFACHPRGSARYRLVVQADLVAGRRIA